MIADLPQGCNICKNHPKCERVQRRGGVVTSTDRGRFEIGVPLDFEQ